MAKPDLQLLKDASALGLTLSAVPGAYLLGRGPQRCRVSQAELREIVQGAQAAPGPAPEDDGLLDDVGDLQRRAARVGSDEGWSAADEDAAWTLMTMRP